MQRRFFALIPLALLGTLALAKRESRLWSLQPVGLPHTPTVKNTSWGRNPIDAFVLAKLEAKGLRPAPEADRRTLIRRVTFDLTGLPPTPQEIAAFLADKTPHAYERLVDRLLASPHYGERWARHWLDVARFGESHGFEYDRLREHAWRYRDWVVEALNADMPYDRFVREQLAGDVLPDASPVATGFLVAGPQDEAGKGAPGLQVRLRAREEELEDMIGLVGQTFLGLTVNCARCHDHKFDPIPAKDYYRLKSALAGVQPGNRPVLTQKQAEQRDKQLVALRKQQATCQRELRRIEEPARTRLLAERGTAPKATKTQPVLRLGFDELPGGRLRLDGKRGRFQSEPLAVELREKTLEAWVSLADLEQQGGSALTIETEGGAQFDGIVFGERQRGKWIAGSEFYHRTKDLDAPQETETGLVQLLIVYRADGHIQLFRNGKPYAAAYQPEATARTYPAGKTHLLIGPRHTGSTNFLKGELEEVRVYDRALTDPEVAESYQNAPFNITPEALTAALTASERKQREVLQAESVRLAGALKTLEAPVQAYAAISQQPSPTYVLPRGDVTAQGELVTPGGLSALTACSPNFGLAADSPEAQRRLALANWLTDSRNPLTARVMVNRVWQGHFGRGIVGTASDFGNNGESPSHPELLDWLATAFSGPGEWSLKKLHRAILLSSTYRQSGQLDPKAAKIDVDNQLLWRFPPRRLEAEVVRDSMLALSGKLNPALGGPSFRPFTVSNYGSDFYQLIDKDTPEFNRRTLYRMGVQSARNPLLETLDCPDPSTKTPKRTVTTTPIQALALMNDSFVLRQSRAFAERLRHEAGSLPDAQITGAYTLAFGRPPTPIERSRALTYLKAHPLDSLCWALFNSSEFLYAK
ncbi:DUF1553 domain-containing protein [Armatimonas sp.]|uniref:DUF1553 domain-containing protein n=1 Tax=Armatimonas sp. TaxID=1872638 RepID=UPI00286C1C80|nr:DUF1553 domain-containing protein [Armatimonas sp.]